MAPAPSGNDYSTCSYLSDFPGRSQNIRGY